VKAEVNTWPNCRRLIKAVINLALKDASGDIRKSDYRRRNSSPEHLINESKHFIGSAWCRELCTMADMDYEQVRLYALQIQEADYAK
jgi:hypothetical protein